MAAKEVNLWKTDYLNEINALKVELLELKSSQEFVCSKYESLKSEYEKLPYSRLIESKNLNSKKKQSSVLKNKQIKDVEELDAVEQDGKRQNLEKKEVPIAYREDTNKIVGLVEVDKSLNVNISTDDMSTSQRLPVSTKCEKNDDSTSIPIIVRFVTRDVCNKIYANRKLLSVN